MPGDVGVRIRPSTLLLVVFVASRIVLSWVAAQPGPYAGGETTIGGDVSVYEQDAREILEGKIPYSDVSIEYPPGVLPFVVAPAVALPEDLYRNGLIAVMVLLDIAGLGGLLSLGKRWGSRTGAWLWVLGIPLLGPLVYVRLDMIPAVASIWGIQRLAAGSQGGLGGFFGFGAAAKLYPALLVPAAFFPSPRRLRLGGFFAATAAIVMLPFSPVLGDLYEQVIGYHTRRGIQIESMWGAAMLTPLGGAAPATIRYRFASLEVVSSAAPVLKSVALFVTLLALAASTWLVVRKRPDEKMLAAGLFAILAVVTALGTVFSPQYVLWLLALGAAAVCAPGSPAKMPALVLLPAAALTHLIYPIFYDWLLAARPLPVAGVLVRNVLVLVIGASTLLLVYRRMAEKSRQPRG